MSDAPPAPGRRSALALETTIVLAIAGAIAVLMTWPVAADIGGTLIGTGGADQLGYLQDFWYFAHFGIPMLHDGSQSLVGAPFTNAIPALPNLTLAATLVPAALLTKVFSAAVAYNILTIAGLALSGASMYLLCRWMGLRLGAAAWAGVAYMVFPYHLLAAQSFVTLVPYWCFPLLLMALLAWTRRPTWRNGTAIVLATALASLTFPYFTVMSLLMVLVTLVVSFAQRGMVGDWRRAIGPTAALAGAVLVFVIVPLQAIARTNAATGAEGRVRSLDEVTNLGPTISEYFTPPANSSFFSGLAGGHWSTVGSVGGERLVYIGAAALVLLAVGLVMGARRFSALAPLQKSLMVLGPPLVAALVIASLRTPYPVGSGAVTMPARWIFEAAPYVRAFGRFVIAIAAVAIALGALGLHLLMSARGALAGKVLLASALVLTGMEAGASMPLASAPPGQLPEGKSVDSLQTYRWLARQPGDGIVFNQPEILNSSLQRPYMYGIAVHGKPVLNTMGGGASADLMAQVNGPPTRETARVLAAAGVRYVVIHAWAYRSLNQKVPRTPPVGFKRGMRRSDGEAVWRVTARPADGFATFQGFGVPELKYTASGWRHTRSMFDRGVVRAHVTRPGLYRATFRAASDGRPRTITARSAGGFSSSARVGRTRDVALTVRATSKDQPIVLTARPGVQGGAPTLSVSPWILQRIAGR